MPWSKRLATRGMALSLMLAFATVATSSDEKRLSIYSPNTNYSLTVVDNENREYVGLLELLEPLGKVSARQDGRRWKLSFNNQEAEFTPGQAKAKVRGADFDLTGNFLLQNGRGLVPLTALTTLLPRFLGNPVEFHSTGRRLFVNGVFTECRAATVPTGLVVHCSAPVNPAISTEPGRLRMVFTREPLAAIETRDLQLDGKVLSQVSSQETNGAVEVNISGSVPLLASFSDGGRTITLAPAPQVESAPESAQNSTAPPAPNTPDAANPSSGTRPPGLESSLGAVVTQTLVIIDAAHGGDDSGVVLAPKLNEKEVTLALARHLRHELQNRGMAVLMLRDADASLSQDQRAGLANSSRAAAYVCLHVSADGDGVRVYTALLPTALEDKGIFRAWASAQSSALSDSRELAAVLADEIRSQNIAVRALAAPLRPLNNLTHAAVAVELSSLNLEQLTSSKYQQQVAAAIARGLARPRPGAAR